MEKQGVHPQFEPAQTDASGSGPPTYEQATGQPVGFVLPTKNVKPMPAQSAFTTQPAPIMAPQFTAPLMSGQGVAQQPQHIIMVQNAYPVVGPYPTTITCPNCHQTSQSRVDYEADTKTHMFALLMCFFGLICCSCIPYCMESCQNANHYCRICGKFIGSDNGGKL